MAVRRHDILYGEHALVPGHGLCGMVRGDGDVGTRHLRGGSEVSFFFFYCFSTAFAFMLPFSWFEIGSMRNRKKRKREIKRKTRWERAEMYGVPTY